MTSLVPLLRELQATYQTSAPNGVADTRIPSVQFFWSTRAMPRAPLLYQAGIVIIGQGHKIGYLGERRFRYDAETFLVLGVPLPFECEIHATPAEPVLGVRIDIDMGALGEVVTRLGPRIPFDRSDASNVPYGVEPAPMTGAMREATARLLEYACDPLDSSVLGEAAVKEVLYRVLQGEKGRVLYALTQHQTPYAAVARALERIHGDYRESLSVEDLALENGMSLSSFHRAFKRVTGDSPLQYLKKIRLDKAMGLLVHEGVRVSTAAYEVGYESASQFSREFKRYFKVPPSEAQAQELEATG